MSIDDPRERSWRESRLPNRRRHRHLEQRLTALGSARRESSIFEATFTCYFSLNITDIGLRCFRWLQPDRRQSFPSCAFESYCRTCREQLEMLRAGGAYTLLPRCTALQPTLATQIGGGKQSVRVQSAPSSETLDSKRVSHPRVTTASLANGAASSEMRPSQIICDVLRPVAIVTAMWFAQLGCSTLPGRSRPRWFNKLRW